MAYRQHVTEAMLRLLESADDGIDALLDSACTTSSSTRN